MYTKKTKIVATIGPVSESEAVLEKLVLAGMNVARLNFSHGDHTEHGTRVERIRKISKKLAMPVAILQDLAGPKIRTGDIHTERIELKEGSEIVLTTKKCLGDETCLSVNYDKLPKEVAKGNIIFLDDGKRKLEVLSANDDEIRCRVLVGGQIKGRRGVNVPGAYLSISSLTEKDIKDVAFGIKQGVDFMAISFVRRPDDVLELRKILDKSKTGKQIKIIAKIETQEAIDNLDEIIKVTDGIMVARGDLGIEVPAEWVPVIQKEIIKKCNKAGIPVITATQMLESMIRSSVPTRAEVNDVANAIFDGTDAIMLSEETTLGDHPLAAVEVMRKTAVHIESVLRHEKILAREHLSQKGVTDSFSYASLNIAHEIKASAIVALSQSGFTARMVSRYRPAGHLIVLTPEEKTYNQVALSYGCYPVLTKEFKTISGVIEESKKILLARKLVKKNDMILVVAGVPFGRSGNTNTLLAHKV